MSRFVEVASSFKRKAFRSPGVFYSESSSRSESDVVEYVSAVEAAVQNAAAFSTFKRNRAYQAVLEHVSETQGRQYLDAILSHPSYSPQALESSKINDKVGNPQTYCYSECGVISPSTLRYLKVALDIKNIVRSGSVQRVAEIGVGYGGQALVLDQIMEIRSYDLFDLVPVLKLVERYLGSHLLNTSYQLGNQNTANSQDQYDLVISNYAFSELPRMLQTRYIERVLSRSHHGYLTMNSGRQNSVFSGDKYSLDELTEVLPNFEVIEEEPLTAPGNYVIIW